MKSSTARDAWERARRWGTTYHGTGDLAIAFDAVVAASRRHSLALREVRFFPDGVVRISAVQRAPWYRTLLSLRPQKVEWWLERSGERLAITADARMFRWCVGVVLAYCSLLLISLSLAFLTVDREWAPGERWISQLLGGQLAVVMLLSMGCLLLLGVLGGGRLSANLWQPVLARIEESGGSLEPRGSGVSRRYGAAVLSFAAYFLALVSWPAASGLGLLAGRSAARSAALGGLVVLALFLLLSAALVYLRRGFMLRSDPLLCGLVSSASMLLFLGAAFPWALNVEEVRQLDTLHHRAAAILADAGLPAADAEHAAAVRTRVARDLADLRGRSWLLMASPAVILGIAAFLFLYGVYLCWRAYPALVRLQRFRDRGAYREAVRGGPLLALFRRAYVGIWILSGAVLLAALSFVVGCGAKAIFPSLPLLELPALSAVVVGLALGRPSGDPTVVAAARLGWALYGVGALVLLAVSTGQLFAAQRTTRRGLRAASRPLDVRHRVLQKLVNGWCSREKLGPITVAILPSTSLDVSATVFGLWRQERYVALTEGCLEHLRDEHVRALLAHEVCHHLAGDCRRQQLLRWLGRFTFVGDGFVITLIDSWGWESAADRQAWERLGVSKRELVAALRNLLSTAGFAVVHGSGLQAANTVAESAISDDANPRQSWSEAWRFFARQYFHGMKWQYWHPAKQERINAILES